jgi:ABC-type branched-subunit amino acid transport system ATPase component
MLSATGLREHETELLWDSLALTEAEEDTISCLRYVVPTLDRVALAASTLGGARPVLARLRDSHSPVPLSSFGGGAVRVFEMAASLAKAQNGFLLIDEFENGLHYSIQPKLWEFLFRSARRLNVQVFATTHSSDTISAFFAAAESVPDVDGVLTTLYEKNGEIHAARLDERDLGVALRANMEVR